jgi:hypothetical protein
VNIRFALAVALFMAQAGCGRLGGPRTENWGSYPDGNVKAEWLPDGTPWTDGQWVGYTIKKTTGFNVGEQQQIFSIITANTSNKITYHEAFRPAKSLNFSTGDQFKLYKVLQVFDQPGRMGGTITGVSPAFSRGSNDQVTSPTYEWDNTPDWTAGLGGGDLVIRPNEHYYTDHRAPPDGTYSHYTYPHPLQKR